MYRDATFPNSFAIGSILFLSLFFFPLSFPRRRKSILAGMTKKENGKNMGETPVLRKSQF